MELNRGSHVFPLLSLLVPNPSIAPKHFKQVRERGEDRLAHSHQPRRRALSKMIGQSQARRALEGMIDCRLEGHGRGEYRLSARERWVEDSRLVSKMRRREGEGS